MERVYVDVLQAWAVDDCTVRAYCDDGRVRQVDMRPFIEAGGVFEQLKNPVFFHTRISAMSRTISWDASGHFDAHTCIDIPPETVYDAPVIPGAAF